jgi:hypothetical protein
MLPPKDQMNQQLNDRFRKREEIMNQENTMDDIPRIHPGEFGPPDFGDENIEENYTPSYFDPVQIQQAYENMDDDEYENVNYEPQLEQEYDEQLSFTPPPKWQGAKDYPTPPSLRQPGGQFLRDEPIFPGGPARSEVNAWKKQFEQDGHSVHLSDLGDNEIFIWRTLSRTEYREIMALPNTDPLQREEIICEVCVLFPANYNFSSMASRKAGIPAVLAEQIMHESGFKKPSPPIRL